MVCCFRARWMQHLLFIQKMGIKGFKIDFFDRDDQIVVASTYEIAKKAAAYKLMVDYHGIFKPTGGKRKGYPECYRLLKV